MECKPEMDPRPSTSQVPTSTVGAHLQPVEAPAVDQAAPLQLLDLPVDLLPLILRKAAASEADAVAPLLLVCSAFRDALLGVATHTTITHDTAALLRKTRALRAVTLSSCTRIPWTTGDLCGTLAPLTALTALDLKHSPIPDCEMQELVPLQSLRRLAPSATVTDAGLAPLSQLTALEHLDLTGCKAVSAAGLSCLRCMTSLRSLLLQGCAFDCNAAFAHVSGLTALSALHFSDDGLCDGGLAHLRGLTALQALNLARCMSITVRGLAHISPLTALQSLNLDRIWMDYDAAFGLLTGLRNLRQLTFGGSRLDENLTDAGLAHLSHLTALTALEFAGCVRLTAAGCAPLGRLASLRALSFRGCNLDVNAALKHLSALTGLTCLDLDGNTRHELADASVDMLCSMRGLTRLNLNDCGRVSEGALSQVSRLTALVDLGLRGTAATSNGEWSAGARGGTALRALNLSRCHLLTHVDFLHHDGFRYLESLELHGCEGLEDSGLTHLSALQALHSLDLSYCRNVAKFAMAAIGRLAALRTLNLQDCPLVDDTGLAHLAGLGLETLHLSSNDNVSGEGLWHVGQIFSLKFLTLHRCGRVDDASLLHLAGLLNLEFLSINGCPLVTRRAWCNCQL